MLIDDARLAKPGTRSESDVSVLRLYSLVTLVPIAFVRWT